MDFHDASIYKIKYRIKENMLIIGITLYDSRLCELVFEGVIGWNFSPFEFQNFLLDFRKFHYDKVPQHIIDNYDVEIRYIEKMKEKKSYLFELDPASGMGGYVIAQDCKIASVR